MNVHVDKASDKYKSCLYIYYTYMSLAVESERYARAYVYDLCFYLFLYYQTLVDDNEYKKLMFKYFSLSNLIVFT